MLTTLQQKVSNINRTRREFYEMLETDEVTQVANRLKAAISHFCKREKGRDALKEALGNMLD
jgi:hypothetical protein